MNVFKRRMLIFALGVVVVMALVVILMPRNENIATPQTDDNVLVLRSDTIQSFQIPPQTTPEDDFPEDCTDWRLSDPPECVLHGESGSRLIIPQAPTED